MSLTSTDLTIHVRYDGKSTDIPFEEFFRSDRLGRVGVNSDTVSSIKDLTDTQIKQMLASYFDKSSDEFSGFVLDREENGNLTCRPSAVFGG